VPKVLEIQPQSLLEALDICSLLVISERHYVPMAEKLKRQKEKKKKQDSPIRLFVWSLTRESIAHSGAFPLLCVTSVRLTSGLYAFSVLDIKLLLFSKGRVLSINSSSGPLSAVSMIFCKYKVESRSGVNVITTLQRLQQVYRILPSQSE